MVTSMWMWRLSQNLQESTSSKFYVHIFRKKVCSKPNSKQRKAAQLAFIRKIAHIKCWWNWPQFFKVSKEGVLRCLLLHLKRTKKFTMCVYCKCKCVYMRVCVWVSEWVSECVCVRKRDIVRVFWVEIR